MEGLNGPRNAYTVLLPPYYQRESLQSVNVDVVKWFGHNDAKHPLHPRNIRRHGGTKTK